MSSIYEEIIKRLDTLATDIAALTINEGAGAAGGSLSGSGTTNRIAQWTGSSSLGDSTLIKSGVGVVTLTSDTDYTVTIPGTGTLAYNPAISAQDMNSLAITGIDYADFDLTPTTSTTAEGRLRWNSTEGALEYGLAGGNVNVQIGKETLLPRRVKNDTVGDMVNGDLVYISGGDGTNAYITLAKADAEATSANTIAMLTEDIDAGAKGWAAVFGLVRGDTGQPIDTSAYAPGTVLYLSPTTAGKFTSTKTTAPNHLVKVGTVFRQHATEGSIIVDIDNGYELDELHDVAISSLASADLLRYNGTVWANSTTAAASIPTGTGAAGQVTYWSGTNTQTGSANLTVDAAASKIILGTDANLYRQAADMLWTDDSMTIDRGLVVNESGGNYSFRVESDVNVNAFGVSGATGYIGMGIAPNAAVFVYQTTTFAPGSLTTNYGNLVDMNFSPSAGGAGSTIYGGYFGATLQGSTAIALSAGGRFNMFLDGTNTTTEAFGGQFFIQARNTSGTATSTNASVGQFRIAKTGAGAWAYTALKFIDVPTFTVGAGSISGTNAYGLYIGSLANTGATNKFSVYTSDGTAQFNAGGSVDGDFIVTGDTENMIVSDASADTVYLGGQTNGIKIEKGGELTLIGTATVWDDLRVEPVVRGTGSKNPSFSVWLNGVYLYDFDNAAAGSEKEVWFSVQMPHSWKEGSAVEPHVHWTNKTAGTAGQVVRWGLEYTKAVIGGTFGATTTVYGTTIVGGGDITVANEHLLTDFASVDMTGDTLSTVIACRLFRNSSNAADTYTGTAGLLYIDWHYTIDTMGSKTEFAK